MNGTRSPVGGGVLLLLIPLLTDDQSCEGPVHRVTGHLEGGGEEGEERRRERKGRRERRGGGEIGGKKGENRKRRGGEKRLIQI